MKDDSEGEGFQAHGGSVTATRARRTKRLRLFWGTGAVDQGTAQAGRPAQSLFVSGGFVSLQPGTSSNVFVAVKSICVPRQPLLIPFAQWASFDLVMKALLGCPKMLTAAVAIPSAHDPLAPEVARPAYWIST